MKFIWSNEDQNLFKFGEVSEGEIELNYRKLSNSNVDKVPLQIFSSWSSVIPKPPSKTKTALCRDRDFSTARK